MPQGGCVNDTMPLPVWGCCLFALLVAAVACGPVGGDWESDRELTTAPFQPELPWPLVAFDTVRGGAVRVALSGGRVHSHCQAGLAYVSSCGSPGPGASTSS